jgi:hypothetical protein
MTDAQVEESTHTSAGSVATVPEGVDWWNVSKPQDNTIDAASLPLDEYAPLLPHDTGCASTILHIFIIAHLLPNSI